MPGCVPRGHVCRGDMCAEGGMCVQGGMCAQGCVCLGGMHAIHGPPVDRILDTCL